MRIHLPNLRFKSTILATAGILAAVSIYGQSNKTKVSLQKDSESSTVITIDIPAPTQVTVNTPRGEASIYFVDRAVNTLEKGAPILPKITRSVIIPSGSKAHVRVVSSQYMDVENISIAPSKGNLSRDIDPAKVPFTYGPTYQRDEFFPTSVTELSKSYTLRQYEGAPISIYPLQYNPITKTLRIYSSITVEVTYTKTGIAKSPAIYPTRDQGFSEVYKSQFINYSSQALRYTPLSDEGSMLIVCHPAFMSAMQPFVDWKNQRGIKTEMVDYTQVATSADALKAYVYNYYYQNGLTFLLLVGDAAQIPAKVLAQTSSSGNGDSDPFYGFIAGDDAYPEVMVGRFSAESVAQVSTMVNRTVAYEKNLTENATWIETAMGIASDEGGGGAGDNGEADKVHMENIRSKLMAYGYTAVSQVYDPNALSTTVSQNINNGVGLINYIGHGANTYWVTTNFGNSDASALTNNDRWPFIFDVACVNGNFVGLTCFAEAFTRAANVNGPTGAVNIVAATINQSWDPPMAGQDEMVNILTESDQNNIRRTFGGIVANGCMGMNDKYGLNGEEMTMFWSIFGDPSLLVRTKTPIVSTAVHQDVLILGQNNLDVTCSANDATATLWQAGKILSSGRTSNGSVNLTFPVLTTQDAVLLTITGHNLKTIVDTLQVTLADKPYLSVTALTPVGGMSPKTEENLNLTVKNLSSIPTAVTDVTIKLRCQDSRISLIDSTETTASVGLDPVTLPNAYTIFVNEALPDLSTIKFTTYITGKLGAEDYVNTVTYTMVVTKPDIKITSMVIDDRLGNGNGNIEPGEVGTIGLTFSNQGHAPAINPAVRVESSNLNLLEILAGAIQVATLNPGEAKAISVQYSAPASGVNGQRLYIKATTHCTNDFKDIDSTALMLGASNYFVMQNGIVSACGKKFFDTGGLDKDYKSSENYTMTIATLDLYSRVKMRFNSFSTASGDNLALYDGPTTLSPLLGSYTGSKTPFEIVSSSSSITVRFTSGSSTYGKGWDADILCVAPIAPPQCPTVVSPLNGATNQRIPRLSWSGKNADECTLYFGSEPTPPLYKRTKENTIEVPFNANTTYYWKVTAINQAGESSGCPVNTFTTATSPDSLLMRSGSAITCNGRFFDSGGPIGAYSNNSRETYTIYPTKPGAMLTANFTQLALELEYDTLYVWDGPDNRSTLIGAFNTETVPTILQNLVANNPSGALTFQLYADQEITRSGWIANIGCALQGSTSEVTLTVTDGVTPLTGATLTIGKIVYHSDAIGQVKLTMPYGEYALQVEDAGYLNASANLLVSEPITNQTIEIGLKRTLTITAKSSEGGAVIYPASIIVNGVNYRTNSQGVVMAEIGDSTTSAWSISAGGYLAKEGSIATTAVNTDLTVEVNPLHHIKVMLLNEMLQQPIKGGQVTAGLQQAYSASDGYTHFVAVAGTYTVSASATGFITKAEESIELSATATTIIALTPAQNNVTIWVKESESNRGVSNATITINSTPYSTDTDGKVVISLFTGKYTYAISNENLITYQGSFELAGEDISITAIVVQSGIANQELSTLNIYPIPANGEITIEWGNELRGVLTVTNITGMVVMKQEITNGAKIDISNLNPGVYLAHVVVAGKKKTVKLIVQ